MQSFSKLKGNIWKIASCFLERKLLHQAAWRACISNYIMFWSQNKMVYGDRGRTSYSPSLNFTWGIYTWSWSKWIQYHIKFYKCLYFHYSAVNLNPLECVNALCYLWVWKPESQKKYKGRINAILVLPLYVEKNVASVYVQYCVIHKDVMERIYHAHVEKM